MPVAALTALGAVIGSFLAVVAIRGTAQASPLYGRSRCDSCRRVLSFWELIPIASHLMLRGRCQSCRAPINHIQLIAELAGAAVGLTAALAVPAKELGPALWLGWLLCLLAIFDIRNGTLPLLLTLTLLGTGLLNAVLQARDYPLDAAIGAAVGFLALALLAVGYRFLRGKEGMGGGDILLAAGLGAWIGPYALPYTLLGAALLGITFIVIDDGMSGQQPRSDESIPFGPWLAISGWATFLLLNAA